MLEQLAKLTPLARLVQIVLTIRLVEAGDVCLVPLTESPIKAEQLV
jgi:hypothetical protein